MVSKVMGLAPYGAKRKTMFGDKRSEEVFMNGELFDGSLNMEKARQAGLEHLGQDFSDTEEDNLLRTYFEDIAHAVQSDLERVTLNFVEWLVLEFGERDVVFAGGVALNSCVNNLLTNSAIIRTLHVPPYPGDEGIAIGCAAFGNTLQRLQTGYASPKGRSLKPYSRMPFLGRLYTTTDIEEALAQFTPWISVRHCRGTEAAAKALVDGNIVAWFNGRSECGPRALGNRSLLADARRPEALPVINRIVKRREGFRPLAPAVLSEDAGTWFSGCDEPCCKYMSMTCAVKQTQSIPSVVHVDGSARVQTVSKEDNAEFHELISRFKTHTGVGVVLNTSLNTAGEPIVESPCDAVRTLLTANGIDMLAFAHVVVHKRDLSRISETDMVYSACESFRSTQVDGSDGQSIRTTLTFVPKVLLGGPNADSLYPGEEDLGLGREESVELHDGLQMNILEQIHDSGGCQVRHILEEICVGSETNVPSVEDIMERLVDLIEKLVVISRRIDP